MYTGKVVQEHGHIGQGHGQEHGQEAGTRTGQVHRQTAGTRTGPGARTSDRVKGRQDAWTGARVGQEHEQAPGGKHGELERGHWRGQDKAGILTRGKGREEHINKGQG